MDLQYNPREEYHTLDGKKLDLGKKKDIERLAKAFIRHISRGYGLDTVHPELDITPVLKHMNENLQQEVEDAENMRVQMVKEQLASKTREYRENPAKEILDAIGGLQKTYDSFKKSAEQTKSININFEDKLPNGFWDGSPEFNEPNRDELIQQAIDA